MEFKNGTIPLLLLVGPTAAGKSNLALAVAQALDTDIISADSAQVYRYLDIGTAKPSAEEQALVRHHLIDMVEPNCDFSVADYQKAANAVIGEMHGKGKLPFMVGGTGLYLKAVTEGYKFGSSGANRELRARYAYLADRGGLDRLYARLKQIDPAAAATINPRDRRRIIRALEVYRLEGRPISEQVSKTEEHGRPYKAIKFGLNMDRPLLYHRINERVDDMIQRGFLDEVRSLKDKGYDENSPAMQILGYRQLYSYLQGLTGWDDALAEIKKQTRNLAKRQLTWFRREKDIVWLEAGTDLQADHFIEIICRMVKDPNQHRANSNRKGF